MKISTLNIYLIASLRRHILAGNKHVFFTSVSEAFQEIGFTVNILEDTDTARLNSMAQNAYAMFHYKDPFHDHALDARPAYIGPFYKLESQTYRQDFRTSMMVFDAPSIEQKQANRFFDIWQPKVTGPATASPPFPGCVLIALQGKLTRRRVGQSMSPIEMIQTTCHHEKNRQIIVKKHPKEHYSPEELDALQRVCNHPRITLFDGDLNAILQGCDYVVSQNSSVALKGLFHRKPGILFAHSEFHHPFQNILRVDRPAKCFNRVLKHPPNFAKFIYWYLQLNSINTSRDWVKPMILDHCREFGWKI